MEASNFRIFLAGLFALTCSIYFSEYKLGYVTHVKDEMIVAFETIPGGHEQTVNNLSRVPVGSRLIGWKRYSGSSYEFTGWANPILYFLLWAGGVAAMCFSVFRGTYRVVRKYQKHKSFRIVIAALVVTLILIAGFFLVVRSFGTEPERFHDHTTHRTYDVTF